MLKETDSNLAIVHEPVYALSEILALKNMTARELNTWKRPGTHKALKGAAFFVKFSK